jgi:hypothetical protein
MGARAKPKAWGDRLPLDDIRGLRLLAAAIYHAQRLGSDLINPLVFGPVH